MNLVPLLTAAENIALPLLIAGRGKREIISPVQDLLALVNLVPRKDHKPEEMSGGEQQRVTIAAALANNPPLLLCDEPTGELDTENKREVMQVFRSILEQAPDKILLIVTHDPELQEIADIVLHIKDGVIVEQLEGADLANSLSEISAEMTIHKSHISGTEVRQLKKEAQDLFERLCAIENDSSSSDNDDP